MKTRIDEETGEVWFSLNTDGQEILDPTPIAPPLGYTRQPSLAEQIRAMVVSEKLRLEAMEAGAETFEESDDFDVGDDFDPQSEWENDFDPPIADLIRDGKASLEQKEKTAQTAVESQKLKKEPEATPPKPGEEPE